ncbi:hypothetical protein [Pseudomonas sp. SJZ131]|uniref:hypothetical protein n=1 Tax=Pseudomonas sp. SJZ131 TaxID=2572895 RepID=UPI0021144217|nr:hypothetical protein [Pseudomonas sp. SJZ131]
MSDDLDHPELRSRKYPIREDMAYQLKVWRFERVGWYVLMSLVVLGLVGYFPKVCSAPEMYAATMARSGWNTKCFIAMYRPIP